MKWKFGKIANIEDLKLTKYQAGKMSCLQIGKLAKWQVEEIAN